MDLMPVYSLYRRPRSSCSPAVVPCRPAKHSYHARFVTTNLRTQVSLSLRSFSNLVMSSYILLFILLSFDSFELKKRYRTLSRREIPFSRKERDACPAGVGTGTEASDRPLSRMPHFLPSRCRTLPENLIPTIVLLRKKDFYCRRLRSILFSLPVITNLAQIEDKISQLRISLDHVIYGDDDSVEDDTILRCWRCCGAGGHYGSSPRATVAVGPVPATTAATAKATGRTTPLRRGQDRPPHRIIH